jgi:hypothetical protein
MPDVTAGRVPVRSENGVILARIIFPIAAVRFPHQALHMTACVFVQNVIMIADPITFRIDLFMEHAVTLAKMLV